MNQPRFIILSSALFIIIVLSGCSGRTANFSFEKNASPTTFAGPGETITYTYVVTSMEDMITLQVQVSDDKVQVNCPQTTLEPGASMTCTASHTTTQEDVENGSLTNHATVNLNYQSYYVNVTGEASDNATVVFAPPLAPPVQTPAGMEVTQSANKECYSKTGEIIVYTYQVHNTGFVAVEGPFYLEDNKADQWDCDDQDVSGFVLNIDEWLTCHSYYKVRESDLGSPIINTTHVEAYYDGNDVYSNQVSTTVVFCGAPNNPPGPQPAVTPPPIR